MQKLNTIAAMQPTFLPWLGYFGLVDAVDVFVILDDVQFDRRSWQQRNKIVSSGAELLITVPVKKVGKSDQLIKNTEVAENWDVQRRKLLLTLQHAYSKSPFYEEYIYGLEQKLNIQESSLANINLKLIRWACELFDISTPLILASNLSADGAKADHLVHICNSLEANTYISPPGSKVYLQQTSVFSQNKINLEYFNFVHPVYTQKSESFISHISFVDALFNEGAKTTSKLIKSSYSVGV